VSPVLSHVLQTIATLVAVVVLAVAVLFGARRLGIGRPSGPVRLVGHLPLDHRRAIYLIGVGETVFIVGASDGGLSKLGEVPRAAVPNEGPVVSGTFADALTRAIVRPKAADEARS
jgi:flagellar biogenesis protein FliO